jgi:hypothetical protein
MRENPEKNSQIQAWAWEDFIQRGKNNWLWLSDVWGDKFPLQFIYEHNVNFLLVFYLKQKETHTWHHERLFTLFYA